jgi:hypothetical protein
MTCLTANLRGRVNAPGLHLQSRLRISFDPFGSPLLPLPGSFMPCKVRSPQLTRCQIRFASVSSSGYRPVNLRLAPAIKPFGLAFQSTSDSRRRSISGSAFQLNLRPSSAVRSFGQPSDQSPACAFDQSSGPAFRSTFDLRLQSTFRLHLPTGLRLASPVDRPACLPTDLQLAPLISLPVQPSSQPLDSRPPVNLRLCLQT